MKNKYMVFISMGFELITLILLAIYGGKYFFPNKDQQWIVALLIVAAFLIWFISLIIKLKKFKS